MNVLIPIGSSSKAYIATACIICGAEKARRRDMLPSWHGQCRKCATKEVASRPENKAVASANGKRHPPPRQNVKNYRRGPENNKWRGGITPENTKIRNSVEMKEWRRRVFSRDNFSCVMCGKRGGNLHADHIKPFALHPELRFELDNGRTLCVPCHSKYGACVKDGRITREAVLQVQCDKKIPGIAGAVTA